APYHSPLLVERCGLLIWARSCSLAPAAALASAAVRMARGKSAQRPVPRSWADPGVRRVGAAFPEGTTKPLSGAVRQRSDYADAFRRAPGGTSNHSRRTS